MHKEMDRGGKGGRIGKGQQQRDGACQREKEMREVRGKWPGCEGHGYLRRAPTQRGRE